MNETASQVGVNELIEEIKRKRAERLLSKINRWPRKNPILSQISECDREMFYQVENWADVPLHTPELQARFDKGNQEERAVVSELLEMGFEVILSQQPITVLGKNGEVLATGKIDGFVKYKGCRFPMEIKSMHPNVFDGIKTAADFDAKPWLRRYVRQLMMYMYGNNEEQGFFLLTNCLGKWNPLPIFLDYGLCEQILQRLERTHESLRTKKLPERIAYGKTCKQCAFAPTCLPDILNEGLQMLDNDHLLDVLNERASLEGQADRYEELDEEAKEIAKAVGKDFILGTDWNVQIRQSKMTRIDKNLIPKTELSKYQTETPVTKVTFVPLGKRDSPR